MKILDKLKTNKGTISGKLGKELAARVLAGEPEILKEAVKLCTYELSRVAEKNIRAGAAKIVECVAMKKPELVAPYLEEMFPALEAEEPQTRWMIIRLYGYCAKDNQQAAARGFEFARQYIREKREGQLCLVSAADRYLGDFGALSKERAQQVYPLLLESCDNIIPNEHDWLLEAFMCIAPYLTEEQKQVVLEFAEEYVHHPRKATQKRIAKLKKICSK